MGIFRQFPYTNFHEMNLDQLLRIVDKLQKEWADFEIDWNKDIAEEVDRWLNEHPEATTTVLDGAITTPKLADGSVTFDKASNELLDGIYENLKIDEINGTTISKKMLKKSSYGREFVSRIPLSYYTGGDPTYVWLQSAEYIDATNHIILGFVSNDYMLSMLVEVGTDFTTIYNRASGLSLGHCNDMAYNPNDGKLYVAPMGTGSYADKIVVVNPLTLVIETAIDINKRVYQISYDRDNDLFYIGTNTNDIYASDFTLIKSNPLITAGNYLNKTITGQGSCAYNGNFILMAQDNEYTYLSTFDYNNGNIEALQEYSNSSYIDEAEAIINVPNVALYILSGQRYVSINMLKVKETSTDTELFDIFGNGYNIPDGSDLNDYYQAGKYFSASSAHSGTMSNVPSPCANRGFTLYVLNHASDWLCQFIVGNSVKRIMLWRSKEGTNAWGTWQYMQPMVEVLTYPTPLSVGDSVQIPTDYMLHYDEITVYMNRHDYSGSVVIPTTPMRGGDCAAGQCIYVTHNQYFEFKISSAGVLTLTANTLNSATPEPYVRIVCK